MEDNELGLIDGPSLGGVDLVISDGPKLGEIVGIAVSNPVGARVLHFALHTEGQKK